MHHNYLLKYSWNLKQHKNVIVGSEMNSVLQINQVGAAKENNQKNSNSKKTPCTQR